MVKHYRGQTLDYDRSLAVYLGHSKWLSGVSWWLPNKDAGGSHAFNDFYMQKICYTVLDFIQAFPAVRALRIPMNAQHILIKPRQ